MKTNRMVFGVGAVAVMALASVASAGVADVIATVTYDDLAGNFTTTGPNTGTFTAFAVDNARLQSSMTGSRLIPVQADAQFGPGFVSAANPADIVISINTNTVTLVGSGSFVVTDVDGDTITGNISGSWSSIAGIFLAFNGALSNVQFSGSSFDGDLGSFNSIFPGGPLFDGAIVQLTTGAPSFANVANSVTGGTLQITPTPGTLALLAAGGLMTRRRRR